MLKMYKNEKKKPFDTTNSRSFLKDMNCLKYTARYLIFQSDVAHPCRKRDSEVASCKTYKICNRGCGNTLQDIVSLFSVLFLTVTTMYHYLSNALYDNAVRYLKKIEVTYKIREGALVQKTRSLSLKSRC